MRRASRNITLFYQSFFFSSLSIPSETLYERVSLGVCVCVRNKQNSYFLGRCTSFTFSLPHFRRRLFSTYTSNVHNHLTNILSTRNFECFFFVACCCCTNSFSRSFFLFFELLPVNACMIKFWLTL